MSDFWNGMPAQAIGGVAWVKSEASNTTGQCVEAAALPGGEVAVRNSRHPQGPALVFSPGEMRAFLDGARNGEFDHLIYA
ncbi:DUF397 domain-containing protein [Kitasatospora sp. NPDC056327]|uniref:DUF397 domain-containing protein n=1 Tax=Kitasatospora sp. NPDC056327 TaxID=3345785 RepID=UPI0035DB91B6